MNKFIIFLSFNVALILNLNAQFSCGISHSNLEPPSDPKNLDECNDPYLSCTNEIPIKYCGIHIIFLLSPSGGFNFNEKNDGYGNTNQNGYIRAEHYISSLNWTLSENQIYGLNPSLPVCQTKLRAILKSVSFIKTTNFNMNYTDPNYYPYMSSLSINSGSDFTLIFHYNPHQVHSSGRLNIGGLGPGPWFTVWNDWNTSYKNGDPNFAARVIAHEWGHVLSLWHPFQRDYCFDTNPNYINPWCEMNNNVMDYNCYVPYNLTPCQLCRIHDDLNTRHLNRIDYQGECAKPNALFYMPETVCRFISAPEVYMQATASTNENSYFIQIGEVASAGNTNIIPGSEFSSWYSGQAYNIPLKQKTGYNFQIGKIYLVKLGVESTECAGYHEQISYLTVKSCTVEGESNSCCVSNMVLAPNPVSLSAKYYFTVNHPVDLVSNIVSTTNGQTMMNLIPGGDIFIEGNYIIPFDVHNLPNGNYTIHTIINGNSFSNLYFYVQH